MSLRFANQREINSINKLSPAQVEQLRVAAKRFDGKKIPLNRRLSGDMPRGASDEEHEHTFQLVLWDVHDDDDVHTYDVFMLDRESGTAFKCGKPKRVADLSRGEFWVHEPKSFSAAHLRRSTPRRRRRDGPRAHHHDACDAGSTAHVGERRVTASPNSASPPTASHTSAVTRSIAVQSCHSAPV